jgi:hypothetical protein
MEGDEIGMKAANNHRGQLRRPAEFVPEGQNEIGDRRCAQQPLKDCQRRPKLLAENRVEPADKKRKPGRGVLIKKAEF